MYRFTHDDEDGILEIRVEGFMPLAAFPAYAHEFRSHVREARMCGRPVRLMIDLRGSAAFPADVADRIARLEHELLTSALDRIAVIAMPGAKASRTIATSGRSHSFANAGEARRWLLAFAHHPMRRAA
ncbi:STAS/SEC14 domain-containing protein [Sphingomonas sp. LB-2]|uniref:STAS/SEC14 domain-containing protein n=1 Tax=Sphingomonas caeni TaxID=2984949 RepID=UPI00223109D0|nr:STAS/SEC14 domain-containing protein [Sphingomonas caeni]MCW3847501.1 STAS/SEC14 domain-containing protein [Sphingomonas caeni]